MTQKNFPKLFNTTTIEEKIGLIDEITDLYAPVFIEQLNPDILEESTYEQKVFDYEDGQETIIGMISLEINNENKQKYNFIKNSINFSKKFGLFENNNSLSRLNFEIHKLKYNDEAKEDVYFLMPNRCYLKNNNYLTEIIGSK